MSTSDDSVHQQRVFKFIEFLTKRLDHTLAHSETSTRHIYLVNGAILAAVYFAFGRDWRLSVSLLVTAFLAVVLGILNWLHANFLHVQHGWYRTIDEEIRRVFLRFENFGDVWPEHLGLVRDRVLSQMNAHPKLLRFRQTHAVYVWIHLMLAMVLWVAAVILGGAAYYMWKAGK